MWRAIALSRHGLPAPNPHVGCVIVRGGEIVGEGWHTHAGAPHAERMALADAGDKAEGADVYVTLEPCNHFGRTPPCSVGLLEAKVKRVFVACPDPNPKAAGGAQMLREQGIPVEMGILADEASRANYRFMQAMAERRPHITVKAAISMDGRIALPSGESQWITSPEAREAGHRLRVECGAVMVGYGTVVADNPSLTARIPGVVNQPTRVVLDPRRGLAGTEKVFDESAPTLWLTDENDSPEQTLATLFGKGITSVLIEGGGKTIGKFVAAGLVDRYELFLAPKILGDGPSWISGVGLSSLSLAPELRIEAIRHIGPDVSISAVPA